MNRFLLLYAGLSLTIHLYAGDGSSLSPYTVSEALKLPAHKTGYVKGYVAGELCEFTGNKYFYNIAPPFDGKPNYLLADDPYEIDLDKCIPVQFSQAMGDTLNLNEYPRNWHKLVVVQGKTGTFFSRNGLLSVTDFRMLSTLPLQDETEKWEFLENFDRKKSYIPANPDLTFAGGIYTGENYRWEFAGATWGTSSNDKKWDLASARIRLTEGTTGEPGAICMLDDKIDGMGYIRFWAGHYDTDRNGKLCISASFDGSKSWQTLVPEITIGSKWQEYQFLINLPGACRLKIAKAENTDAGINVDNIRISAYSSESLLNKNIVPEKEIKIYTLSGGIKIESLSAKPPKVAIYTFDGKEICRTLITTKTHEFRLPKGCYVVRSGATCHKIIIR